MQREQEEKDAKLAVLKQKPIRMDSILDDDPKVRADVILRMKANSEISDAKVRHANIRAAENMRKIDEDLEKAVNFDKKISS